MYVCFAFSLFLCVCATLSLSLSLSLRHSVSLSVPCTQISFLHGARTSRGMQTSRGAFSPFGACPAILHCAPEREVLPERSTKVLCTSSYLQLQVRPLSFFLRGKDRHLRKSSTSIGLNGVLLCECADTVIKQQVLPSNLLPVVEEVGVSNSFPGPQVLAELLTPAVASSTKMSALILHTYHACTGAEPCSTSLCLPSLALVLGRLHRVSSRSGARVATAGCPSLLVVFFIVSARTFFDRPPDV